MLIAITADHNGVPLKRQLTARLEAQGHEVDDRGTHVGEEVVDYPPLCEDVCRQVLAGEADFAIVVGGGGSGETIACNKLPGIRAVSCPSVWQAENMMSLMPFWAEVLIRHQEMIKDVFGVCFGVYYWRAPERLKRIKSMTETIRKLQRDKRLRGTV